MRGSTRPYCPKCGNSTLCKAHELHRRGWRWLYVLDKSQREDGKRHQERKRGFRSRAEAEAALRGVLTRLGNGTYVEPTKQTYGEFLREWLEAARPTLRPSSWERNRSIVEVHLIPRLGNTHLQKLSPPALNAAYADWLGTGLSPASVRRMHAVISRSLRDAVRWSRISRNVAQAADPPKLSGREMTTWSAEEARTFLTGVRSDRLYALWHMAIFTGMRLGELLGLRWQSLNLESGHVSVERTLIHVRGKLEESEPKTARGRRSFSLDAETVSVVKSWHTQQAEERLMWGPGYEDQGLVFCWENGKPLHPQYVGHRFQKLVKRAKLRVIRFHDLRHTPATLGLNAGVHPKAMADRLGHDVAVLLRTYSHVAPEVDQGAASRIASVILGS